MRGEDRTTSDTRIRFITPGIALRQLARLRDATTVILDELHERRLDVDLLLALLRKDRIRGPKQLVVMSATLDAERVATHLDATLLQGEGRVFPVDVRYRDGGIGTPSERDLAERVASAVMETEGDTLVFLPGKSEIRAAADALRSSDAQVLELHGGMSLDTQARVFRTAKKRKVVLSTNVAETSLTVPGIEVVIDSGLVRQTRYHRGRAHLALRPIAQDAADQRSGRAGRTRPGIAVRLWARRAALEERSAPEVHRESLVPLVLGAAASGYRVGELPLLDAPKAHAVDDAEAELRALGALDADGRLTGRGRDLVALPIEPALGRMLIEARSMSVEALQDTIDLAAVLSTGRRLFTGPPGERPPFRTDGCDAAGSVRALRGKGGPVDAAARREARRIATRLRRALDVPNAHEAAIVEPARLCEVALRADPRSAHVARRRGKGGHRIMFAGGGTELALAEESAAWKVLEGTAKKRAEALVVFDVRAFGVGHQRRLLATCASPCSLQMLRELGVGTDAFARAWVEGKGERRRLRAEVETQLAGKVLGSRELVPTGSMAEAALLDVLKRGALFPRSIAESKRRLKRRALAAQLGSLSAGREHGVPSDLPAPPTFERWIEQRVQGLGLESGDDIALLSDADVLADDLPFELQGIIDDLYPHEVSLGDAAYRVELDLDKRSAILTTIRGGRSKPPSRSFLPKFPGLKVFVEAGRTLHRVV
ncbi:MAG: helicase-related protein [Myxococcota bacterium]